MTATSFDVLMDGALSLPMDLRSRLATLLLASLDQDETELSPAWQEEIRRRSEAAKCGTARRIPHEEVMAEVRDQLARQRDGNA